MHTLSRSALPALLLACSSAVLAAQATVPGNANPNLAGRDGGYACCSGDSVPAQSPVLVSGLTLVPGQALVFTVSGQVSNTGNAGNGNNPDGEAYGDVPGHYGDGISAPTNVNRINALAGVFLGDTSPTGAGTPARIDYAGGLDFASTSPEIGQIFFIGHGRTGDTLAGDFGGAQQTFIVPTGATRLFLGTTDGYGWYNNNGEFSVQISAVPEPAVWLMAVAGMATTLGGRRLRRRG
jgi:hypothetical protein